MRRSSYLTGGLLIACGAGCLVAGLAFADEGPVGLARSPFSLVLWGVFCTGWGGHLIARARAKNNPPPETPH
jgi:hypothetical protein